MQSKERDGMGGPVAELLKHREAISKLASGSEARELMHLLDSMGGVQQAAQAAAGGNTGALTDMVQKLMQTEEGAKLAERIAQQARQAGLE